MTSLNFRLQPNPLLSQVAQSFGVAEARNSSPDRPTGYACISATGDDAERFLQGQMTSDVSALAVGHCQPSALCNPKGRVIAPIEIAKIDDASYLLILANHLVNEVTTTLTRYILRSKVTLGAGPGPSGIILHRNDAAPDSGRCRLDAGSRLSCRPQWLPVGEPSWELSNIESGAQENLGAVGGDRSWAHAHVLLGLAPPVGATALEHIPQMLNLDKLNAVSMTKGCYTGQEIIARVHHRGAVKRRLRRYVTDAATGIVPGAPVETTDGASAGMIVEAAEDDHHHLGVLAVIQESRLSSDTVLLCDGQTLDYWPLP